MIKAKQDGESKGQTKQAGPAKQNEIAEASTEVPTETTRLLPKSKPTLFSKFRSKKDSERELTAAELEQLNKNRLAQIDWVFGKP